MPPKRPLSPQPSINPPETFKSSPIKDRASTFIAIYSPTLSSTHLQQLPELKSATHRIAAERLPSTQLTLSSTPTPTLATKLDDDGERHGAKHALRALENSNTNGSIVVARWYGGIMLGPIRFEHIHNCAREAIALAKQARSGIESGGGKKVRAETNTNGTGTGTDEETQGKRQEGGEDEKVRLLRELPERDANIVVLRSLLAKKKGEAATSSLGASSSPAKVVDYDSMTLRDLRRMEKVRDATISWILKGIEKVEEEQEVEEGWAGLEAAMVEEQKDKEDAKEGIGKEEKGREKEGG